MNLYIRAIRRRPRSVAALISMILYVFAACAALAASPPVQPNSGPGSSNYPFPAAPIVSGQAGVPGGDNFVAGYTIYEPSPRPTSPTPVIIVIPGNCITPIVCQSSVATHVGAYAKVMTHFAKKGNIVIYLKYQSADQAPAGSLQTQKALDAVAAAITKLQTTPGMTPPDLSRLGLFGHSRGGWIGVNLAARLSELAIHPDYLMSWNPPNVAGSEVPQGDWSTIPSDMKLIVATGESDGTTGESTSNYGAEIVFSQTNTILTSGKDFVRVRKDYHGIPQLWADHNMATDSRWDAMDFYLTLKLTDAHRNCTGFGTDCQYAQGDTPEQRNMGSWSDGVKVIEPCITDNPTETWALSCANSLPP